MAKDIILPEKAWLWGTGVVSYDDAHYTPLVNPSWFKKVQQKIWTATVATRVSFTSSFVTFITLFGFNVGLPETAAVISPWMTLGGFGLFASGVGFSSWKGMLKRQKKRAIRAETQHVTTMISTATGNRVTSNTRDIKQLVSLYFHDTKNGPDSWKANGTTPRGPITYKLGKASLEDGTPAYALAINGVPRQQITSNKALVHTFKALKDDKLDHHTAGMVRVLQARAATISEMNLSVEHRHVVERVQTDAEEAVRLHVNLLTVTYGDDSQAAAKQRQESYDVLASTLVSLENQLSIVFVAKQDEILQAAKTHGLYVESIHPKTIDFIPPKEDLDK